MTSTTLVGTSHSRIVPYFFSPLQTKHTHKKTNKHSYKTNSKHITPNLRPQVGLLKGKKKHICGSITYIPTLLFVLLLATLKLTFPFTGLSSFGNKSDRTSSWSPELLQQLSYILKQTWWCLYVCGDKQGRAARAAATGGRARCHFY